MKLNIFVKYDMALIEAIYRNNHYFADLPDGFQVLEQRLIQFNSTHIYGILR